MNETANTTQTPALRSITLPCPMCGDADAGFSVRLALLGDEGEEHFHCHECDQAISVDTIRAVLDRWPRLLAWLAGLNEFFPEE